MKIVFFEMEDWEHKTFDPLKKEHEVVYLKEALNSKTASEFSDADIVSVFIYSKIDRACLSEMGRLKMISTRSTGYDHIDLAACNDRSVKVCNVPVYGENTVAEHVFALLLTLSHRLVESFERAKSGQFSPKGLEGFDLQGKVIGVIGTGHIGSHVVRIAKGFEMKPIAFDLYPNPSLNVDYVSFDELLACSDIITLHVPGGKENYHLLGKQEFNKMKKGVVIINTARGDLIDAEALIGALAEGKVKACGLDVLADEPYLREEVELLRQGFKGSGKLETLVANHILLLMKNVVITPHNAFHTREALQRILNTTYENLANYLAGRPTDVV